MVRYDLAGTLVGMILVYTGLFAPFAVFLYANFFRGLPVDYEEAAQVDGARPIRAFIQIVLPLVRPVTGTVAVLIGILVWKDFLHPLIFLGGSENVTLPVAIHSFVGEHVTQWNLIFAGIVIALAPILVVYGLMQRYVVQGFTSTVRG
jgi:raffinose/stachyose/melibiose transport system permease protein